MSYLPPLVLTSDSPVIISPYDGQLSITSPVITYSFDDDKKLVASVTSVISPFAPMDPYETFLPAPQYPFNLGPYASGLMGPYSKTPAELMAPYLTNIRVIPSHVIDIESTDSTILTSPLAPLLTAQESIIFRQPLLSATKLDVTYVHPAYDYENLNRDPRIHSRMTKYYYFRLLDDWLYDDLVDILNYVKIDDDDKISFIKSMTQYKPSAIEKDTEKIAEMKIEFIEERLISKYEMYKIIRKFIQETRINWVHLSKNEFFLKQFVEKELIKKIRRNMK